MDEEQQQNILKLSEAIEEDSRAIAALLQACGQAEPSRHSRLASSRNSLFEEGMELSLDDVGAGYANLRFVCELKPHFIKVDKFFVVGVADNPIKQSIIGNLINIASGMGATTIAEGVERRSDAEMVMRLEIDMMQGHLFASTN